LPPTAVAQAHSTDVILTISGRRLSVRLTRGLFRMEVRHIDLARRISAIAHARDAGPARASASEVQLAIAAKPDESHIEFWRAVLGYAPASDDNAIDPLGHGSTVWMQGLTEEKHLRHAMHIDVSVARAGRVPRLCSAQCRRASHR